MAHGGEVFLKALIDLWGIVDVVQPRDSIYRDALDPCAKRGEVCTSVVWCAQDDVGVLCHRMLLING